MKKVLKRLFIIVLAILILSFIYNLSSYIRKGKLIINVTTSSSYYNDSNIIGMIEVQKYKDYSSIPVNSKVKIELLDKNSKKVKRCEESIW